MTTVASKRPAEPAGEPGRVELQPTIDPRAVRVSVAAAGRRDDDPTLTLAPAPLAVLRPIERVAGVGPLGGTAVPRPREPANPSVAMPAPATGEGGDGGSGILLDGEPLEARLRLQDRERAILGEGTPGSADATRVRLQFGPVRRRDGEGIVTREVVVEGWRVEVDVEAERRASLRERARRGHEAGARTGPVEVHAIIPGRIVAVSVKSGDTLEAGQQILVLEAMKMQNELRAPREGTVERVAVAVGENVEVGDLLLVIT